MTNQEKIEKWLQKQERKFDFFLLKKSKSSRAEWNPDSHFEYTIISREKNGIVRICKYHDDMHVRHGAHVYGTLSSASPTGLWQESSGAVSDSEYEEMLNVYLETTELPLFDIRTVKLNEVH